MARGGRKTLVPADAGAPSETASEPSAGGDAQGVLFEAALTQRAAGAPRTAPPADPVQPDRADDHTPDHRHGHRQRLRERFATGGPDALPDYELMELVLFRVFPRGDTKPLAKRLVTRFGSFAEAVNAPDGRLLEVDGVGDRVIDELRLIRAAALRLAKGRLVERPLLSSWSALIDYLHAAQAYDEREAFRVLFLDKRNRLIADEVQGRGTVDHTPVYVREVVKRALELSATALILVHNHPSGDPTPSRADIDMTRAIVEAARPLGVAVHDHVIVGRGGHASLKAMKLM